MPVAVAQPNMPQQDDPLDKLAKVLGIAKAGFGIAADMSTLQEAKARRAEEDKLRKLQIDKTQIDLDAARNEQAGILTGEKRATLLKDFVPAKEGQKGAFMLRTMGPNGQPLDEWFVKAAKEPAQRDPLAEEMARARLEPKPDERKAATFAERVEQAEAVFTKLHEAGFSGTSAADAAERSRLMPEGFKSSEAKQRQQAERNFINALLRRESGASIMPSEFDSAEKQYFPRWGDDETVLAQKAENRRTALEGLRAEAGPRAIARLGKGMDQSSAPKEEMVIIIDPKGVERVVPASMKADALAAGGRLKGANNVAGAK